MFPSGTGGTGICPLILRFVWSPGVTGSCGMLSTGSGAGQEPCLQGRSKLQRNLGMGLIAPAMSVSVDTGKPKDRGNGGNR